MPARTSGVAITYASPILVLILLLLALLIRRHFALSPSNERSWVNDNRRLAKAEFDGETVTIRNVRDFKWRTTRDFDERWVDVKVNLNEVTKIWFIL